MRRIFLAVWTAIPLFLGAMAAAQPQGEVTSAKRAIGGSVTLQLALPQSVPFRVTHLAGPDRVLIELRGALPAALPDLSAGHVRQVRVSRQGEWSRISALLEKPMVLDKAKYRGEGRLEVRLRPAEADEFAALAAIADPRADPAQLPLIALDPGHGGIDPGALRHGVSEKEITLAFGLELAELLRGTSRYRVLLTRQDDRFVSLGGRVAMARTAGADLFLSLHANTVTEGDVSGSTVYVLSNEASDAASAAMAAFENGSDGIVGHESDPADGDIVDLITRMNRRATAMRSGMAARLLVAHLADSVGVVGNKPLKSANFKVLQAPDMPSLLLEVGFLSNRTDLARMQSETWRAEAGNAVLNMLDLWQVQDRERLMLTDLGQ